MRSAGSGGQKTSRRNQDGQRLRQKAGSVSEESQHTRSQKQEKRPNREAVETGEQSSVVSINDMISFIL